MVDELIKFLVARDRDLANLMNFTTAQIAVAFSGGKGDITMADFLPFPPESKIDRSTIELIKGLQRDGFISRRTYGILVTAKAIVLD
jgi:hypothetical protein